MNLNIIIEILNKGYYPAYTDVLYAISIIFAVYIIVTNNPIVSVLYLIGLFVAIALYLIILGLQFIGLSYLLVYVGAISILFLFILMLINVRTSELLTEGKNSIPLAIITLVCFSFTIDSIVPYCVYIFDSFSKYFIYLVQYTFKFISSFMSLELVINFIKEVDNFLLSLVEITGVGNSTSNSWDTFLIESNHISSVGNSLYGELFIFLIITGFVLLLAMVGTIVITIKRMISGDIKEEKLNLESAFTFNPKIIWSKNKSENYFGRRF